MKFDYDLFVIGGGSGGVRAARLAAGMGKKVAIAEEYRYGGTCVIRGCVPKKLFVYASRFSHEFADSAGFGWGAIEAKFHWPTLRDNKDREIDRLEGLYRAGLDAAGAEIFSARATLVGLNEIALSGQQPTITAERILIAVGGRPNQMAGLAGHEYCITSNEAFDLERLPRRIVIVGGGYIAVEFACIFNGLGVETTLVYRGEEILRGFDGDLRAMLHQEMSKAGLRVICNATPERVERHANGDKSVLLSNGETLNAGEVMLAVGRVPNTEQLGLENASIDVAANGAIVVDPFSRTSAPNIAAVGDVTNRVSLTPVAIHEAMCFIETEFGGNPVSPDHELIATAVFSEPEIGTIGLSEEQAGQQYQTVDVYRAAFRPLKHTLSGRDSKMLTKLVVDSASDRVLGVHILGPDAGEMAQLLAISLKMGATKADFDRTMAVHPTASEELVTSYQPSYRIIDGKRV